MRRQSSSGPCGTQELNLVYGSIRARMTEKEAETLRIAELEWMKERDQAAARAAEASPVPQNQTHGVQKGHGGGNAGPVLRTDGRI